jgi:dihydrofolate reductase
MNNPNNIKVAIIVAQSSNRVIGLNNQLPWNLPEDLQYFKRVTMGKPIIMGRKTYESIGRPLPGRKNIVITRQANWSADGVMRAGSVDQAIELAKVAASEAGIDEVMVIGGAEIYSQAMAVTEKIYLTQVDVNINGDAFFPALDLSRWSRVGQGNTMYSEQRSGEKVSYKFFVYEAQCN